MNHVLRRTETLRYYFGLSCNNCSYVKGGICKERTGPLNTTGRDPIGEPTCEKDPTYCRSFYGKVYYDCTDNSKYKIWT
jgi:hypothetical protein